MQEIIKPVPPSYLLAELTADKLLGETNHGNNLIYVVNANDSPAVMTEIGRLREVSFREAGGGTGHNSDIDAHDLSPYGYRQVIIWNPHTREIVGGYRFNISHSSLPEHFSTEEYYTFSSSFRNLYLPYTIELGRSFIQPKYQAKRGGVFALDNLWDGLGAVVSRSPSSKYLFGKVTVFPSLDNSAKELLYYFLHRYHKSERQLVCGKSPLKQKIDDKKYKELFKSGNYQENFRLLCHEMKELGSAVPSLIKSYINLSPTMQVFDTVRNDDFGGVEETAILITISDIYADKRERHFAQKEKLLL